jgi:TonB family protein
MVVTAAKKAEPKPLERPDRTLAAELPKKAEPKPKEQLAQKGQEKQDERAKVDPERERKPAAEERQSPPAEDEPSTASSDSKKESGLWVAEGKAQEKREESGARETTPRPLAEGKPKEQPVALAMASTPRAPGAGDEQSRRAQMASEFTPQPKNAALTSLEDRLKVEAFEGGEEGARRADQSGRTLAAPERKLVGLETAADHQQGQPNAGRIVVVPDGDGSGDEAGMAAIAGNADLRRLVQERVNYVASLVGPGLVRRSGARGIAVVKFRVDFRGYVRAVKLERSSGSAELDREIEPVIRLAEPYTGWIGWMRVAVCFGTPFLDF